jgi:hypothetical protein
MTEKSTAFEQRIERIHSLLARDGAVVTWNDKIPDPDNPDQPRQIDVTIRDKDDATLKEDLTIIEGRIHKSPQDVMWIEQLIGRRISLKADTVIAVSASGFTEGARLKAAKYGIILRDFATLTEEEIRSWGRRKKVQLCFFEFTETVVTFRMSAPPTAPYSFTDYRGRPVNWRGLFEQIMRTIADDRKLAVPGATARCNMDFDAPIFVNGKRVVGTKVQCRARRLTRDVSITSLVAYADPLDADHAQHAVVGELDMASSEIVEVADRVTIVVDLSGIEIPPNSLFSTILYDFGRVVTMTGTKFIGIIDAMNFGTDATIKFEPA